MPNVAQTLEMVDTWIEEVMAPRLLQRALDWIDNLTDADVDNPNGNVRSKRFRKVNLTHGTIPEHTNASMNPEPPDMEDPDSGILDENMQAALKVDFVNGTAGLIVTFYIRHESRPDKVGKRRIGWRKGRSHAPGVNQESVWEILDLDDALRELGLSPKEEREKDGRE